MVMDRAWVAVAAAASVTFAVKDQVPAVEGVPERVPPGARVRPGGRGPEASEKV